MTLPPPSKTICSPRATFPQARRTEALGLLDFLPGATAAGRAASSPRARLLALAPRGREPREPASSASFWRGARKSLEVSGNDGIQRPMCPVYFANPAARRGGLRTTSGNWAFKAQSRGPGSWITEYRHGRRGGALRAPRRVPPGAPPVCMDGQRRGHERPRRRLSPKGPQ